MKIPRMPITGKAILQTAKREKGLNKFRLLEAQWVSQRKCLEDLLEEKLVGQFSIRCWEAVLCVEEKFKVNYYFFQWLKASTLNKQTTSKAAAYSDPALRSQSLILRICYPELHKVNTKDVRHGCTHEASAIHAFDESMKNTASSAVNKRGFSQMKLTKTIVRSQMTNATLNYSMVIQMVTPEVKQFDPDPSINQWVNGAKRPRQPVFKHGSLRKCAHLEKNPHLEVEVEAAEVADTLLCFTDTFQSP
ncbi:hypothetical protein ACROYT_G014082 [Oculina patagonica]